MVTLATVPVLSGLRELIRMPSPEAIWESNRHDTPNGCRPIHPENPRPRSLERKNQGCSPSARDGGRFGTSFRAEDAFKARYPNQSGSVQECVGSVGPT